MKAKTLFQILVLALLVFAEVFTVFPVSAKPASAGLTFAPLATDAGGLKAPFTGGLTRKVTGTHDRAGGRHALDFGMSYEDVLAMKAGTIVRTAFEAGGGGNMLFMDNGDFCTAYLQLEKYYVTSGYVSQGTIIAQSGATGNVTGPNLHVAAYFKRDAQCTYSHVDEMPMIFDEAGGRELVYDDSLTSANFPNSSVISILRANPSPTNATSVNFTVTFSESVTGVDVGDFTLTKTGAIISESIAGVSGSGSTYTVSVNTGAGDGTLRLDIPASATVIPPLAGLPYTSNESYTVDKTKPTVVSVVRVNPNPTNLSSVGFTVTFSEAVTGVDAGDFIGSASVSGSGSSYTVSVNTGADGSLCLDMSSATITDSATNSLDNPSFSGGECYMVDKTAPTVEITLADANPTNAGSVNFNVKFSEDVVGVDNSDFSGGIVSGSGSAYTVTVTTSADGNLCLDILVSATITDLATNSLALPLSGTCYKVDKTPPTVTITFPVTPSAVVITPPSNPSKVDFTVTFSEDVTGVDIADFILTKTGKVIGESITGVSGGPSVYTVSVNRGTGEGNLCLSMPVGATVNDLAGNPLAGLPITPPVCLMIDETKPTVVSVVPDNCNGNFIVTFSEDVTGVGVEDFLLTKNGTLTGVSIKEVIGGPAIYTVVVDTGKGEGTLRLIVPLGATVNDMSSNSLIKLPYTTGKIYTILSETFRSNGFGDGWALESSEGSGLGGSVNSTAITFNVGDDIKNRQYRAILHFPTDYLPDNAVALQSFLKIKKLEEIGTPFASLGNLSVDIRKGLFVPGLGPLTTASFAAKADADAVGTLLKSDVPRYPYGIGWYEASLDGTASSYINPLGGTQIRLGFQTLTNKNGLPDYVKFYSGDAVEQKDRPHLEVRYCVPR